MFIMNFNLLKPMNVQSALGFSIQVNMKKISSQSKQTKPTSTSYKKKSALLKNFYATKTLVQVADLMGRKYMGPYEIFGAFI